MEPAAYIWERQRVWARRRGTKLQGSKGERGQPAYTHALDENLFRPLSDATQTDFTQADGGELNGNPCKMQAVHSTAALACNVFDYWRHLGQLGPIAEACRIPASGVGSIRFEAKLSITDNVNRKHFPRDPNIDVLIEYEGRQKTRAVGIECKFSESYTSRGHGGLKLAYQEQALLWERLPGCLSLGKEICPDDGKFKYLHAAQLIKHILGLNHKYGPGGYRLLYLWYDVFGEPGQRHREEVDVFGAVARGDGVSFQAITYQEMILALARTQRETHREYVDYLTERYL